MSDSKDTKKLQESAAIVSAPWSESPYYDHAEGFTHVFWNENTRFRKLFNMLDLTATLELSCGHGRHAERTAGMTSQLTLVDIHESNLAFCRNRLKAFPFITYVKNDGFSYEPVGDETQTAIYCYDSMVHFSPELVESYLKDTARILKPGGMGLFHHSNYPAPLDRHYGQNPHARNHMTQSLFIRLATEAKLSVVNSMIIQWAQVEDLDCITLVRKD
jgi:ubiquinone/menaquinone biosynthesis C-methylase UbiE